MLRYNALLNVRHNLLEHSVVVLLRPVADGPAMDGLLRQASPDGRCRLEFRYQVVRIWELSVDELAAGIGMIRLAALVVPSVGDLPAIVDHMQAEFARHPTRHEGEIWAALYLLIGDRFEDEAQAQNLLEGARGMNDSVTYQAIPREGRLEGQLEEARMMLVRLGTEKFQEPEGLILRRIEAIDDLEGLETLEIRVLHASSWGELLADAT